MKTVEEFIRHFLGSLQMEYSELEESCPEILEEITEDAKTFLREAIKEDRKNVAKHATIWTNVDTHGDHDCQSGIQDWEIEYDDLPEASRITISAHLNKDSIINAPNIELK